MKLIYSPNEMPYQVQLDTKGDLECLAEKLALACCPGAIIELIGPLGVGKTTFCQQFLRTLGHAGKVKSPTYTLVETYPIEGKVVHHFDLYRLNSIEAMQEIGFEEYADGSAILLIEWADIAYGFWGKPFLSLTMKYSREHSGREISFGGRFLQQPAFHRLIGDCNELPLSEMYRP